MYSTHGVATFRVDVAVARDRAGATDARKPPQWLHAPDERDHLLFDRLLGTTARLSPQTEQSTQRNIE